MRGGEELYHRPATAFAAEFVGQSNLLGAEALGRQGECMRCRLEGGLELRVPVEHWPAAAGRVRLSIRPENVRLSRSLLERADAFAATVEEELFKGAVVRCTLKTDAGTRLGALASGDRARGDPVRAGERVWCAVDAHDIVVLPAMGQ